MVLMCAATNSVLETLRCFQRQFLIIRGRCRQTLMDKFVQDGLHLNKDVGNSVCQRTARTEANIDMVRRALEVTSLMTARHYTLPHLCKSSFNRITNEDLTSCSYRMERSDISKKRDYPRQEAYVLQPANPDFVRDIFEGDRATFPR